MVLHSFKELGKVVTIDKVADELTSVEKQFEELALLEIINSSSSLLREIANRHPFVSKEMMMMELAAELVAKVIQDATPQPINMDMGVVLKEILAQPSDLDRMLEEYASLDPLLKIQIDSRHNRLQALISSI